MVKIQWSFDPATGIISCSNPDEVIKWLTQEISHKIGTYCVEYRTEPRYIKIPKDIYKILWAEKAIEIETPEDAELKIYTFLGLICCPTTSINRLEEIEIF